MLKCFKNKSQQVQLRLGNGSKENACDDPVVMRCSRDNTEKTERQTVWHSMLLLQRSCWLFILLSLQSSSALSKQDNPSLRDSNIS